MKKIINSVLNFFYEDNFQNKISNDIKFKNKVLIFNVVFNLMAFSMMIFFPKHVIQPEMKSSRILIELFIMSLCLKIFLSKKIRLLRVFLIKIGFTFLILILFLVLLYKKVFYIPYCVFGYSGQIDIYQSSQDYVRGAIILLSYLGMSLILLHLIINFEKDIQRIFLIISAVLCLVCVPFIYVFNLNQLIIALIISVPSFIVGYYYHYNKGSIINNL